MRRKTKLGAASDDPTALARRAIREVETAIRQKDRVGVREGANKGYLAVASAADVAAAQMGMKEPGGASGRRAVLEQLEKQARLRRGSLLTTFETTRGFLHGECFHGDRCPSDTVVLGMLDNIVTMTQEVTRALGRRRRRR